MKNIILLLSAIAFLFVPMQLGAHEKATVKVSTIQQKGNMVAITVLSSQPFKVGGNVYVLHIGGTTFAHGKQSRVNGKGSLVYYLQKSQFDALNEGAKMFLTYGKAGGSSEDNLTEMSASATFPCWALGNFSKQVTK